LELVLRNELQGNCILQIVHAIRDINSADIDDIRRLLNAKDMSNVEVFAARANLTRIVNMLHDPASRLIDALLAARPEEPAWPMLARW
jgi:hypothetical protein